MMGHHFRALWNDPRPAQAPGPSRRDWALVAVFVAWSLIEALLRDDLLAAVVPGRAGGGLAGRPLVVAVSGVIALTLPWRRTRPLGAVVVAFGTLLAFDVLRIVEVEGTGLASIAAVLLLPYALCRWGSGREVALGLTLILSWLAVTHVADPTPLGEMVAGVAFFLLSAAVGAALRFQAHARTRAVEQAKLRERSELARELHDAVGHHVSAIAIQAQAGRALAASQPERALGVLGTIEEAAARALAEMRAMVGVLREDAGPELAPRAGVADIRRLVREDEGAARVDVQLTGDLENLSPAVDSALYRIAQEAVTNALRHARQASEVNVIVDGEGREVRLSIRDDGAPGSGGRTPPGYGLVGMAERASLLGGTLQAGLDPDGGWTVDAVLPKEVTRT
jgi:signal transduction histidine kinase